MASLNASFNSLAGAYPAKLLDLHYRTSALTYISRLSIHYVIYKFFPTNIGHLISKFVTTPSQGLYPDQMQMQTDSCITGSAAVIIRRIAALFKTTVHVIRGS